MNAGTVKNIYRSELVDTLPVRRLKLVRELVTPSSSTNNVGAN
jgi:hypothetical protein